MVVKLYGVDFSIAVRSTLLTLKALGVEFELVKVDPVVGDQLKPEFIKINPLHTIPTIEDGDFVIWDSHAINGYLVGKYGKDDSLYPVELEKKALVDNRMYFECGVMVPKYWTVVVSLENSTKISNEKARVLIDGKEVHSKNVDLII